MDDIETLLKAKIPCPETGIEVKRTICDICCPCTHCGIDAYVKDGRVIKVEGTKEHPRNKGKLCAKGHASRQYIYRADACARRCAGSASGARANSSPSPGMRHTRRLPGGSTG